MGNRWLIGRPSGFLLACTFGLLTACQASEPPSPSSAATPTVRSHLGKDGTQFLTSLGNVAALPEEFPRYLIFPQAQVSSSGTIRDTAGGIASLLLETEADVAPIVAYYQDRLWQGRWDLLSHVLQEEIVTLTFERIPSSSRSTVARPERWQQVVVQIGKTNPTSGKRDLLVLYSNIDTQAPPPAKLPSPNSPFAEWLLQSPAPLAAFGVAPPGWDPTANMATSQDP
ncbi:MAG: hypothetical protein NW237_12115 [Cyanobacteriota bacterium]|nr:hypothetical protein [Cyanobacteriota bacterium]